ncbi:SDR family oxidoreductase [Pseudonocardia broussonetiae]|uniref:SDR family oxidoreductase n=1 Tax=Pseudonocardia broussonetiae TaxID=2736640 RepID=UPI003083FF20
MPTRPSRSAVGTRSRTDDVLPTTGVGGSGRAATPAPARRSRRVRGFGLQRFGRAEEIASVAAFLASPGADCITGSVVDANGGSFTG